MADSRVLGIGVDLVEVARMRASAGRSGGRFAKRVFTPGEIAYCEGARGSSSTWPRGSPRKEAALKALGTGHHRVGLDAGSRGGPRTRRAGRNLCSAAACSAAAPGAPG